MNREQQMEQFIGALCLWREARGESVTAKNAIWHVIINRSKDPQYRWPHSVIGVILQKKQFSSFNLGEVNSIKFPIPNGSADWTAWLECCTVVENVLGSDPTQGANHYEALRSEDPRPDWVDPSKLTATIGRHRFYRL